MTIWRQARLSLVIRGMLSEGNEYDQRASSSRHF